MIESRNRLDPEANGKPGYRSRGCPRGLCATGITAGVCLRSAEGPCWTTGLIHFVHAPRAQAFRSWRTGKACQEADFCRSFFLFGPIAPRPAANRRRVRRNFYRFQWERALELFRKEVAVAVPGNPLVLRQRMVR